MQVFPSPWRSPRGLPFPSSPSPRTIPETKVEPGPRTTATLPFTQATFLGAAAWGEKRPPRASATPEGPLSFSHRRSRWTRGARAARLSLLHAVALQSQGAVSRLALIRTRRSLCDSPCWTHEERAPASSKVLFVSRDFQKNLNCVSSWETRLCHSLRNVCLLIFLFVYLTRLCVCAILRACITVPICFLLFHV